MLINFCDGIAKSLISCDKVCTDSNPIENLLCLERSSAKGFMVESFVRPPVSVTLQFPCNIEIFRVVINPVVGSQKSNGFGIYTCSNKVDTTSFLCDLPCKLSINSSLFVPIGKMNINEPGIICFTNNQYRHSKDFDSYSIPPIDQYKHRSDLRHGRQSALTFVSHLTIRIIRTFSGSAVCIRRLEIWGRPSKSCSSLVITKLRKLFSSQLLNKSVIEEQTNGNEETNKTSNDLVNEQDLNIPEEFLDSITFELMTVPMLLPCGKNIDQLSLEKHISSEASWGRMPSDPFTGMVFDTQKKAIPNLSLKGRIDQFVLLNSDKLNRIPRTLGRDASNISTTSRLTNIQVIKPNLRCLKTPDEKRCKDLPHSLKRPYNMNEGIGSDYSTTDTSSFNTDTLHHRKRPKSEKNISSLSHTVSSSQDDNIIDLTTDTVQQNSLHAHDRDLKHSLNNALANALGTLPSFTRKSEHSNIPNVCCSCKTKADSVFYLLSCSHNICRKCLTKNIHNSIVCNFCKMSTNRKDINRAHIQ